MVGPCRRIALLQLVLGLVVVAPELRGEEAPGSMHVAPEEEPALERRDAPDPAEVPEVLRLPPAAQAAPAALEALRSQPVLPGVPYQNGFSRNAPEHLVRLDLGAPVWMSQPVGEVHAPSGGAVSWRGRFVVEGAAAFRILLADLVLPEGARIWVHAGESTFGPYGRELLDPEGNLYLPPVPGPEAVAEIEMPADAPGSPAALRFILGGVVELVEDPAAGRIGAAAGPLLEPKVWTDCDVDSMCIDTTTLSTIDQLREAIARLSFVDGGISYLCSGGLLNDTDTSGFRPFLLTANHCFDDQTAASSLVAYFDYRNGTCDGTAPSLGSVPSVAGATLLASSPDSDFTFVELSGNPAGTTWYLGWTTASLTSGQAMDRVSHPAGGTQRYSASSFTGDAGILCGGYPTSNFHYSEVTTGSTAGGSSGAPVTINVSDDARVVGQLLGACHMPTWDDCSYSTYNDVDGAFSVTFPVIEDWLDPPEPCAADVYEPDGSSGAAGPILSGAPQAHSICPEGDEDWVSFTLGDESGVELETTGPSGDTRMWLYDGSVMQLEFDDDSGTNLFSFIDRTCGVDPLPAGTYYVKVDDFGDDDTIPDYTLSYTRIESCAGTCPNDLVLANTTLTGTESHRAHVSITLGPSLTVDGTAIDVLAGQSVVFESGTAIGGSFSAGTHPDACGQ